MQPDSGSLRRHFIAIVGGAALAGGLVFGAGWWVAGHLSSTSTNSQNAATDAAELKASATQRTHEIQVLQSEVKALKADQAQQAKGTAIVGQILVEAGHEVSTLNAKVDALDAQLVAICQQRPGCTTVAFPPDISTTTTTTPHPATPHPAALAPAGPPRATTSTTTTATRPGRGHRGGRRK